MLAHLQRSITLTLLGAACAWLLYFRQSAPLLAVAGFLVMTLAYTGFLALQFMLLRFVNQTDPGPQPTAPELCRAWLGESWTAPRVFCWRQPFRAHAIPDALSPPGLVHGRRGVVFVHGFFCNRGFWTPWLQRLQGRGHAFEALSLEPLFGSIDDYVPQIEAAVQRITQVSGLAPLLVCHSMGGLAARAWLKAMKSQARVHHVVTIGTPHRGTWLAQFSQARNGRQMRPQSDWLEQLDQALAAVQPALFTCWYANSDNIVFPISNATLPGAHNRMVRGVAHVQMAFLPQIMDATLAMLEPEVD